jgi:predicted amidohydrolase YtcJ
MFLVPAVLLSACNAGQSNAITQSNEDIPTITDTAMPDQRNLALAKPVTASSLTLVDMPKNAVDGNLETVWNAEESSPQWIQIDLGAESTISSIRLTVAQYPNGTTSHQILAGASASELKPVREISGYTSDNDVLEIIPDKPLSGIRFIKVLTTQSPSWVAWREIEVFGTKSSAISTPRPITNAADVIFFNGTILTMEKGHPTAEAIAIKEDTILAVGNEGEVMSFKGDGTTLIDLQGLTLTPGFIDSHSHRIGDRWQFGDVSAEQMMDKALSQGWTSIHELFVFDQRLDELVNIDRAHAMPLRISMYLTMNFEYTRDNWWQNYQPLHQFSPYLQIAGLKITLDREWGEQVFFTQDQYTQMILDGTRKGWQIATHSFSPKANQIVLNGYAAGLNGAGNDDLRLRLEHIGTLTDEQLRKMAELGIIGSVGFINSGSLPDDASFKKYIPANEVKHTARWRDLINAGIFLIGNTDDPWCCTDWRNNFQKPPQDASVPNALYQSITFNTFSGRQPEPWQIAQAVTVQEALEMLTINGAYAAHQENTVGSLKPGKYADIVILSANPLTTPVEQIRDIDVLMTMVGGNAKYCAPGYTTLCNK